MGKDYKNIINILKKYGHAIECIEEPTEEMKLIAVKEDGYAIEHIENPSEEVQLLALKKEHKPIERTILIKGE